MSSHNQITQPASYIENFDIAWDIANAEKPYRELESHARQLNLGHVATDMAQKAVEAGDQVQAHAEASDNPLNIRFHTFEEAKRGATRRFSDNFIDKALSGELRVGGDKSWFVKAYMDQVAATATDTEVIRDPIRIAKLYETTSKMILRNLQIFTAQNISDVRRSQLKDSMKLFQNEIAQQIPLSTQELIEWCNNSKSNNFPVKANEYHGFYVDNIDILSSDDKSPVDLESNFKIQRQIGGVFVMAYSDARVVGRKARVRVEEPNRRIYLNPNLEDTPEIFEKILRIANTSKLPLQLKMYQRAPEAASLHRKAKNKKTGTLRGDGIVVYVNDKYQDEVLAKVLEVADEHASSFRGRETSRIPTNVGPGIAIGDEPNGVNGRESLTSHRCEIIEDTLEAVKNSGVRGDQRYSLFRREFEKRAIANGINPKNFAFNL